MFLRVRGFLKAMLSLIKRSDTNYEYLSNRVLLR